jgi:hypothetical protein
MQRRLRFGQRQESSAIGKSRSGLLIASESPPPSHLEAAVPNQTHNGLLLRSATAGAEMRCHHKPPIEPPIFTTRRTRKLGENPRRLIKSGVTAKITPHLGNLPPSQPILWGSTTTAASKPARCSGFERDWTLPKFGPRDAPMQVIAKAPLSVAMFTGVGEGPLDGP